MHFIAWFLVAITNRQIDTGKADENSIYSATVCRRKKETTKYVPFSSLIIVRHAVENYIENSLIRFRGRKQ